MQGDNCLRADMELAWRFTVAARGEVVAVAIDIVMALGYACIGALL
jgi:hypothetical protein